MEGREACGVFGIYSFRKDEVAPLVYNGLIAIQHRGQDSAGIATFDGKQIHLKKGMGLTSDVFSEDDLLAMKGTVGIGSVRYPTCGSSSLRDAQPFKVDLPREGLAIAHNGNLVNFTALKDELNSGGTPIISGCDSEIILKVLADELNRTEDIFQAVAKVMKRLEGAYCEVILTGRGELIAFRDPNGFRPLCFGRNEDCIIFASESVALDINDVELTEQVKPGEAILVNEKGVERRLVAKSAKRHCMFEYVYFSRPDSILDAGSVYNIRVELGKNLAKSHPANADVIIPVPDTSRPAAEGFSRESGIKVEEGLIKNRYIMRTFIMPEQSIRDDAIKKKLNPLKTILKGKRVIVIDDSIVRGTTTNKLVKLLKDAGAKEVHVRITCPPIISPCFYGIDISSHSELIAFRCNGNVEEIRKILRADSLGYQTIEGLVDAIGIGKEHLCMACLNEDYPTPGAAKIAKEMKKRSGEEIKEKKRYWEI
ncbi:amidophosphoribosyltransferase [Candidatus Micrarchaeota archaeon]|nr:amidophosphoribosyltransferase [Candidatus Micrarchaeota archaeon]